MLQFLRKVEVLNRDIGERISKHNYLESFVGVHGIARCIYDIIVYVWVRDDIYHVEADYPPDIAEEFKSESLILPA